VTTALIGAGKNASTTARASEKTGHASTTNSAAPVRQKHRAGLRLPKIVDPEKPTKAL